MAVVSVSNATFEKIVGFLPLPDFLSTARECAVALKVLHEKARGVNFSDEEKAGIFDWSWQVIREEAYTQIDKGIEAVKKSSDRPLSEYDLAFLSHLSKLRGEKVLVEIVQDLVALPLDPMISCEVPKSSIPDLVGAFLPVYAVRALEIIEIITDGSFRTPALRLIATALVAARYFGSALDVAQAIAEPDFRHRAMVKILVQGDAHEIERALDLTRSISNNTQRYMALTDVALARESRGRDIHAAVQIVWTIPSVYRSRALKELLARYEVFRNA
ncbi:MAG: hypothetical protein JSR76_05845 [Verrucomicrobia bacterium]|nr:hypothetical protein [Verrucomicrobiota bacterium]